MKKLLIIIVAVSLTGCNKFMPFLLIGQLQQQQQKPVQPGTANIPVIIVAGQSNAVGQGDTGTGHVPGLEWRGGDYERGIGEYFAMEYLRQTNRSQAIVIQCAVGGTGIAQWSPGGALDSQCQVYYQKVLTEFPTAKVATVLFWQGEADVTVPGTPWAADFSSIVHAWRSLYGNVPVEFCQLATNHNPLGWLYWDYIQAQQASVSIPNATMVKTADIGNLGPDELHMTATGLEIIGQRLAQAYFGIIDE